MKERPRIRPAKKGQGWRSEKKTVKGEQRNSTTTTNHISELPTIRVVPFQVFLLDQTFDRFFDHARTRLESLLKLVDNFVDELSMLKEFTILHDSNDTCLLG